VPQVLGPGKVDAAILAPEIFAHDHPDFEEGRESVAAGSAGPAESLLPIRVAHAPPPIAFQIRLDHGRQRMPDDGQQDRPGVLPPGNGDLFHGGAAGLQLSGGFPDRSADVRLGLIPFHGLLDDSQPEAGDVLLEGPGVVLDLNGSPNPLRIPGILSRDGFQGQRHLPHRSGHGADLVQGVVKIGKAEGRNQSMGGLDADDSTPGSRDARAAPLVDAQGEIDLAGRQGRPTAARRTAGGILDVVGVADRAEVAGLIGPAHAETIHVQLADNGRAGIQ